MKKIKKPTTVKLKTGIDASFLAETLTTDIELIDAIFDLIDNSIDAARNHIISNSYKKDEYGLPSNYSGYEITLRLSESSVSILDNCFGFNEDALVNNAFYTGKRSNHLFGIGHYGLGLKRALLKAGTKFGFITDNGVELYKGIFDTNSFSGEDEADLYATRYGSSGKKRTLFIASGLKANVIKQLKDKKWFSNTVDELAVRYAIFLKKGLKIKVSYCFKSKSETVIIQPSIPSLRSGPPIDSFSDELTTEDLKAFRVNVNFDVGVHNEYRFSGEADHNAQHNKKLTKTFGVYFICNDRVIVAHSTERKHGFTATMHSEHNGFVCLVKIVGENPADLPWNTAKTEIKVNSPLFHKIKDKIEPLALQYRSKAKAVINAWLKTKELPLDERKKIFQNSIGLNAANKSKKSLAKEKNSETATSTKAISENQDPKIKSAANNDLGALKNTKKHSKNWETLVPSHFPISDKNIILDNMIIEAAQLSIKNAPHAACLLYRSIFEAALKNFVKNTGNFKNVIDHYYTVGEGKNKGHSDEYKKAQNVDLNIALHWLVDNSLLFPVADRKKMHIGTKNVRKHIPKMNGVVHGNNVISDGEVTNIRNETIELLEFLVIANV